MKLWNVNYFAADSHLSWSPARRLISSLWRRCCLNIINTSIFNFDCSWINHRKTTKCFSLSYKRSRTYKYSPSFSFSNDIVTYFQEWLCEQAIPNLIQKGLKTTMISCLARIWKFILILLRFQTYKAYVGFLETDLRK